MAQYKPTDTSNHKLFGSNVPVRSDALFVSNHTGTAATFRLFFSEYGGDYTVDTALYYDVSVPANTTVVISDPIFFNNIDSDIGVQCGTASAISFTLFGTYL